jgi:hypothetical protein
MSIRIVIKRDWQTRYNGAVNVEAIADCLNTRDDIVEKLKGVKVPMLIQGEKDITWTVEKAEILQRIFCRIPSGRLFRDIR